MPDQRGERVMALFGEALTVPSGERDDFLARACGDDRTLLKEIQSLLRAHDSSDRSFDSLPDEVISPALVELLDAVDRSRAENLRGDLERRLAGKYRIFKDLGGGMSRVFLAEEMQLSRRVVVKVLPPELVGSEDVARFRHEISLIAQLQHPHIVPLLTSDSAGDLLYYTMPFVAGESLRARLLRQATLPVRDALYVWRDMLAALAHAHDSGVIHGDVKPENVLLTGTRASLSDFGVARAVMGASGPASADESPVGTPAYMPPEQLVGTPADHRADLYAAGLVMHEMLEGGLPFPGETVREISVARLTHEPLPIRRADCPPRLAEIVARCLARAPGARPASAHDILADLEKLGSDPPAPSRPSRWRRWMPAYATAIVVALLGVGAWAFSPRFQPTPATPVPTPAIAVMPLVSLSADPADVALAEGMTQELTAHLARSARIRVAGNTSVMALRERRLNVRQIAESLGVSHLLEGALQRSGSRLRWQLRLVGSSDGSTRWSQTYDRDLGDIFAVQDEIARNVTNELNVRLLPSLAGDSRQRYRPNLAAYEWFLKGSSTALLRTTDGRRRAVEYFNRAIDADPNFAAAHAGIVWAFLNLAGSSRGDHREWFDRALRSAERAVQLDDSLPEAHAALGWAHLSQRAWQRAEAAFLRAVTLDPAVHRGYEGLARLYMLTRQPGEQLMAARRGLDADPYSHAAIREMALALSTNGRCDEALELLHPLKTLEPPAGVAGVIRGICYLKRQAYSDALAEFRWSLETNDARTALAFLGYTLARSGQTAEARRILDDLVAGRRDSHGSFGIAVVHAGLGELDETFRFLRRAMDENSWRVYIMDPLFDELHRDPRFDRLAAADRRDAD